MDYRSVAQMRIRRWIDVVSVGQFSTVQDREPEWSSPQGMPPFVLSSVEPCELWTTRTPKLLQAQVRSVTASAHPLAWSQKNQAVFASLSYVAVRVSHVSDREERTLPRSAPDLGNDVWDSIYALSACAMLGSII